MTKKELQVLKLAEKGGNDATLLLLDMVQELQDEIEEMKQKHEKHREEMPKMMEMMPKMPETLGVEIKGAEVITIKGDKPVAGIDYPIPKDGEDYILTEEDKQEIAGKITVPIVEKVIEKTEVIREQPIIKETIKNEIREVAKSDTAEQVRDKLETLKEEERLDVSAIKGLDKYDKEINSLKEGRPIFGPGKTRIILVDLSSQLDGVTKTFKIGFTHFGIVSVQGSSSPFGAFRPIVDYTEVGNTIVFDASIDASIALAQGQSLVIKVLK